MKVGNGKLAVGREYKLRRTWKGYFEGLYNIYLVALHISGFGGAQRNNYFGRDPVNRTEVEVNEKA